MAFEITFQTGIQLFMATASVAGGAINILYTKKKIKQQQDISDKSLSSNIVSTARIQWIQEVRSHTATLLSNYQNLERFANFSKSNVESSPQKKEDLKKAQIDFEKELYILRLYFVSKPKPSGSDEPKITFDISPEITEYTAYKHPDDIDSIRSSHQAKERSATREKNVEIINEMLMSENNDGKNIKIQTILNNIVKYKDYVRPYMDDSDPTSKYSYEGKNQHSVEMVHFYINKLVDIIAVYLKIEWDRAKQLEK